MSRTTAPLSDSACRVTHRALLRCPLLEGFVKRLDHRFGVQAFMDMVPYVFSGVRIGDQTQLGHTRLRRYVGDVRIPYFLWRLGDYLSRPIFEQVWMPAEAMMAVCRSVIGPSAENQFAPISRDIE